MSAAGQSARQWPRRAGRAARRDRLDGGSPVVLNKGDRDFIGNAAHGGLAEIDLSKLAQKSVNPDVRRFADRMIADHTKMASPADDDRASRWRRRRRTRSISSIKSSAKSSPTSTTELSIANYARAMVVDHDQAIKLFQQEETTGRMTRNSRGSPASTLPTLQEHRRMAVALADKLGATAAR